MPENFLVNLVSYMVVLLLSLTVHEYGHALAATLLGDDTAARQDRLTLNPIPHIDPIGTLLIPLFQIIAVAQFGILIPLFGYAKPVPVNSARFTRKISLRRGEAITAAAGPGMNIALATVAAIALGILLGTDLVASESARPFLVLLQMLIYINIGLACFNLIPVPPLDGGWLLQWVLPARAQWVVPALAKNGLFVLLIAAFGPDWLPIDRLPLTALAVLVTFGAWATLKVSAGPARSSAARVAEPIVEWGFPISIAMVAFALATTLIDFGTTGLLGLVRLISGLLLGA